MSMRIVLAVALISGCGSDRKEGPPAPPSVAAVEHYGKLSTILGGDWSASASLDSSLSADSYALGALSELRGEFAVVQGEVWLSYPTPAALPEVHHEHHSDEQVALLVVSNVP